MAKIYDKSGERVVILNTREQFRTPFVAGSWTDLRFAFMLSLTAAPTNDDTTTGLAETLGTGTLPVLPQSDRYTIGVTDRDTLTTFLGFTNRSGSVGADASQGKSILISSNSGVDAGTTFWRPKNEVSDGYSLQITDQQYTRAISANGSEIHFAQTPATNYATLLMFRLQRPNAGDQKKLITLSAKQDLVNRSGDILFTNTPTKDLMITNLQNFPTSVQTLGPINMSREPNMVFMYWPFRLSRLRVHAREFLRYA